MRDLIFNKCGP